MAKQQLIGDIGQGIAATYLQKHGLIMTAENFRVYGGEIDLIVRDPKSDEIVFVEVKTLSNAIRAYPEEQITRKKLQALYFTAGEYARLHRIRRWRLDVVAVTLDTKNPAASEVKHWRDVSGEDFSS